jgi:hydroxymethylglutaryl-CoA synthase
VALAAEAARRVIACAGIAAQDLGMLVVGTETGVDHSKPVASYVHGLLGLPSSMRVFDTQHACYGGTAGLMAALEWIASGAAGGKSALVICSDIARYGLHSAGEPTQGGGAVAMIVGTNPALVELDIGTSGTSSTHVHDFWRPIGQREAQVDGHYSVQCYLDALAVAYRGWKTRSGMTSEALSRICYHVPFCKMAKKAHMHLRRCDLEDAGVTIDEAEECRAAVSYAEQVEPSLHLCARVGNVYTGSLYLGLAGLLEKQGGELANQRVGMFSYGSGCTSEFFSGVVSTRAAGRIAGAHLADVLAARERISIAEYERIMALTAPLAGAPLPGGFRFSGVVDHRRTYAAG